MAHISITVSEVTPDLAQKIISLVHGVSVIKHEDRPDTGKDVAVAQTAATPAVSAPHVGESTPPNPFAAPAASVPVPPSVPVPAAVPAAPSNASATAPAVPAAPGSTVETDSRGLPWDPRIHASTKTKTQKGVWTAKRGLNDEAMVHRIEEELRATLAARAPGSTPGTVATAAVTPPPPAVVTAAGAAVGLPSAETSSSALPPAPPVPSPSTASSTAVSTLPAAPSAPTPAVPSSGGETFGMLMARLAPILQGDAAKAQKINEALAAFGLQSIAGLAQRTDLIAPFAQTVDAMLAA